MDEKRQVAEPDDIQDALASMMAVEPSPAFAARVRQRIAADADVPAWRFVHLVLPALVTTAVVMLCVLLTFAITRRSGPERARPAVTRVSEPEPVASAPSPEPAAVVAVQ